MVRLLLTTLLPLAGASAVGRAEIASGINPVRKVVTLLQKMQSKVAEEGETAQALYDKFMCYCKTGGGDLAASISAAEAKIPELASALKEATSKKQQLDADLKSHNADRADAKASIADATAIRAKEKAAYDKSLADSQTNLAALRKATAAISEGMGSFLQTKDAAVVRSIIAKQDITEFDRRDVLAFLSGQQGGEYAPASGEIVGILKQIGDEMQAAQDELVATEKGAVEAFESLLAAKKKEIAALSASIESKMARTGELGVEIANLKNDGGDTAEGLAADRKMAADLEENCGKETKIHEEAKAMRAEEMVALADTIKVLNDDDALELFKQTLPSASSSLLQLEKSGLRQRAQAAEVLAAAQKRAESSHKPHLDFILLALNGKKAGFGKIIEMVDELVASLKTEQGDDDAKKEYCGAQFDQVEDKIKGLKNAVADKETEAAEAKEGLATLVEEIAALKAGIVALDKSVATATENRKAESAAYKALVTSNSAAKELILFAKNRLNKFYNPKLYKAPPKRQLSESDQIYVNEGGVITTAAPGGIAGTGVLAFVQLPPPPATAAAYTKKSEESGGVIAMMDLLVKDLDKELQVSGVEEKNGQEEYEQAMKDAASKRTGDSKALVGKEAARADLESLLEDNADAVKGLNRELMGASKFQSALHSECDWLLQYYEVRKQARADEIDSLGRAKAVLSGADYSLVQRASTARARKFLRA